MDPFLFEVVWDVIPQLLSATFPSTDPTQDRDAEPLGAEDVNVHQSPASRALL